MALALLDDLDPAATLSRVEEVVRERRASELEDLRLAAHWADLHSSDPRSDPRGGPGAARRRWSERTDGRDRLVRIGGEGTPRVQELSLAELAVARGVHTLSVRSLMADVLDLQHRLPSTWAVVESLACESWVARKVAALSRDLPHAAVHVVDLAVAAAIGGESPGRVIAIAEAKIIEADRAAHATRVAEAARRRFVHLSRTGPTGLRHVIARISAGDAAWVDATLDRVAHILTTHPDLRPGTPEQIDRNEARALALGWLARPAELLTLLLDHQTTPEQPDQTDQPEPEEPVGPSRAVALPDRALELLRRLDPAKLRPRATLYVHLHQAVLDGSTTGVARIEGAGAMGQVGPLLLDQVRDLLAHTHVALKPVIDLHDRVSVNAYEHPEAVKERLHLRTPGEVFPHATRRGRSVDIDHPVPYDPLGPPGQTGDHNAAPLGRTHHRAKTHLGYRLDQLGPGEYLWRTPHGLHRHVDHTGTHPLDPEAADLKREAANPVLDAILDQLIHQLHTGQLNRPDPD